MAEVVSDLRFEYAAQTMTLYRTDENGESIQFGPGTTLHIERIDNSSRTVPFIGGSSGAGTDEDPYYTTFGIDLTGSNRTTLVEASDELYDFKANGGHHIYSVKDLSNVYMAGKAQIYEVAGP